MKLFPALQKEVLTHAKEEFPKECAGIIAVVKGRRRYFPCKNLAETPDEHFILDPNDYLSVEEKGEIMAVVHSHPKTPPTPSPADRVACEKSGVPWFIVNPNTEKWGYCEPVGFTLPYVGREFSHGIVDCYSLCRDWYGKEFGIKMSDYNRRDEWWYKGENLYLDNFHKEGFHEIKEKDMKYGDALLMHLESPVPNHAAIYIGDDMILHHVQGRLSSRDLYGGYYQKMTAKILRHESC